MPQSKYWCFTLNNYSEDELAVLQALDESDITYIVIGKEVGDSGTPHLQGYVELKRRKRMSGVKRLLGSRVHIERRGGTSTQAATYCKKDDPSPYEFGEISEPGGQQGRRTDLEAIRLAIVGGASETSIAEQHFSTWVVHSRAFARYRTLVNGPRRRVNLKVCYLWGAAGVGKTRFIFDQYPEVFSVPDSSLRWFDGYRGERVVLIDDYRGQADISMLLRVLDIYPLQVPVKGGFVPWNPEIIFMTSNMAMAQHHTDETGPVLRRIHHNVECVGEWLADLKRELSH